MNECSEGLAQGKPGSQTRGQAGATRHRAGQEAVVWKLCTVCVLAGPEPSGQRGAGLQHATAWPCTEVLRALSSGG